MSALPAYLWEYSSGIAEAGLGMVQGLNRLLHWQMRQEAWSESGPFVSSRFRRMRWCSGTEVVGEFDVYTKAIRNCWRLLDEGYMQSLCCPEPTEIGSYAVRLPRSIQHI